MKRLQILSLGLGLAMFMANGCSKSTLENQSVDDNPQPVQVQSTQPDTATHSGADTESNRLTGQSLEASTTADNDMDIREAIYFEFDSDRLDANNQTSLSLKAKWLHQNPQVNRVLIEGHCDERGTDAYNMALGARRAETVRDYLINLGVANNRLATQSYGEEKPADSNHNEAAWAKNRRANFAID